jgi:hypothetical protein
MPNLKDKMEAICHALLSLIPLWGGKTTWRYAKELPWQIRKTSSGTIFIPQILTPLWEYHEAEIFPSTAGQQQNNATPYLTLESSDKVPS